MTSPKAYLQTFRYYLPPKRFTNADYFERYPDTAGNKNLEKVGIQERRHVEEGVTASDMAVKAAEKLFAETDISPDDIDYILFCAQEFDHYTPTTACLIQNRLGIPTTAGALDYNLGCSGYVYGLSLAKGLIEAMDLKNVLLLTSSSLTRTFHEGDKSSWFLFGDGAAASVISAREEKGFGSFVFGTEGNDKIIVRDGMARHRVTEESSIPITDNYGNTTSRDTFFMNGTAIFVFGMKVVPAMINELLEKEGLSQDDVDLFVFHQANGFMIESIRKKVGIPEDKFVVSLEHCGNTVSSSIPIALYEAEQEGRLKRGQKVLLAAFGTGLSWAGTIMEY